MKTLASVSAVAATAAALAFGALTIGAQPAQAESYRTDCLGDSCVQWRCNNDGDYCTRVSSYDRDEANRFRRARYACDSDGFNCHWTRSYYLDDFGNPIYDPGAAPR